MQTVLEILSKTEAFFAQKGVPSPKTDAQLLLAHALECKRLELFLRFDEPLSEDRLAKVRELVRRRGRREPLQHILGTQEFFGASIKCDSRALCGVCEKRKVSCPFKIPTIFAGPRRRYVANISAPAAAVSAVCRKRNKKACNGKNFSA